MKKQETHKVASDKAEAMDQAGDIGEEELPALVRKTDKAQWNLACTKIQQDSLFKRIVDWGTKDWGYR